MKLAAIILAAGYSSRMGDFKPLMELGGQSLLACCAGLLRRAGIDAVTVVTGHCHREVEAEAVRLKLNCIHNPDYDRGMYQSICAAVAQLAGCNGFFLLPVDIPLVRPPTVAALSAAFDGESVLHPCFDGLRGHPPLIPARYIPDILAHDGSGGLKAVLEKRQGRDIAVWDRGILMDADTTEDFSALERRASRLAIGETVEARILANLTMPEQGVAHGLAVAETALAIGQELNVHGCRLDLDLLYNGALLHDIAKGNPRHEIRGSELLAALGLAALAPVVAAHRDAAPPATGRLTEKEVVCLADKLVRGTRRVGVDSRFAEKLELHAGNDEACRAIRVRLAMALALQAMVEKTTGKAIGDILGQVVS
jgi:molybdenum cofactor cytidylyltransferase